MHDSGFIFNLLSVLSHATGFNIGADEVSIMPECTSIGVIHTPFTSLDEIPRQGHLSDATGTIHLDATVLPGLEGVVPGMEIDILWFADRADRTVLTYPDRSSGIFALRSPDRPNPICVTSCEVLDINDSTIRVQGVDMLDGSPVIDLKPTLMTND